MRQTPKLTVDAIIPIGEKVVLVRRGKPPFQGMLALPGGFVELGETVEKAVIREVLEETGLETRIKKLFGVYSDPNRDPRFHTASIVFIVEVIGGTLEGGDDAADAVAIPIDRVPDLAFDHSKIIKDWLSSRK